MGSNNCKIERFLPMSQMAKRVCLSFFVGIPFLTGMRNWEDKEYIPVPHLFLTSSYQPPKSSLPQKVSPTPATTALRFSPMASTWVPGLPPWVPGLPPWVPGLPLWVPGLPPWSVSVAQDPTFQLHSLTLGQRFLGRLGIFTNIQN